MAAAQGTEVHRNFEILLQLVDMAVSAHSRGDTGVRDHALEELEDIIKNYRLHQVLSVLGNHI